MWKSLTQTDGQTSHSKFVNFIVLIVATFIMVKKVAFGSDASVDMFYGYLIYGCGVQTVNKALDTLVAIKGKAP